VYLDIIGGEVHLVNMSLYTSVRPYHRYEEGGTPNFQLHPYKVKKRLKYHASVIKCVYQKCNEIVYKKNVCDLK
jgi:hypothetical protein